MKGHYVLKQWVYSTLIKLEIAYKFALSENFKSEFDNMVRILEEENDIFFPKLFMNMRNSREVAQAAKQ